MEFDYYKDGNRIKVLYWTDCSLDLVEKYAEEVDTLELWYPKRLSDDIYEKYSSIITYIEYNGSWERNAHSGEIDLDNDIEEIIHGFGKTCQYKVRRAEKRDGIFCCFNNAPDGEDINRYYKFYNLFAESKGLNQINRDKIDSLIKNNSYSIAEGYNGEGKLLVSHGYILDYMTKKVSLCTSSSLFRSSKEDSAMIARANRYLHYRAMLYYKECGFNTYDFGGLYLENNNDILYNISEFKLSFGCSVVDYRCGVVIKFSDASRVKSIVTHIAGTYPNMNIVIWGASWMGIYAKQILNKDYRINEKYFIDNKLASNDEGFVSEDILYKLNPDDTIIIVTTSDKSYRSIIENQKVECFRIRKHVVFWKDAAERID